MTRDDVADMARAVNLPYYPKTGEVVNLDKLVWFARLVAAVEREECAKVCDLAIQANSYQGNNWTLSSCAKAIRARKEK